MDLFAIVEVLLAKLVLNTVFFLAADLFLLLILPPRFQGKRKIFFVFWNDDIVSADRYHCSPLGAR